MKIVITGVGGLIRKYLIEELSCLNFYIIKIKKSLDSGKLLLDNRSKFKLDYITHLASLNSATNSFENLYEFFNNNLNLSLQVAEFARIINLKVIYFSSYVYGKPNY